MSKKKSKVFIIMCILFCLVGIVIIYTRPTTIKQRYPFLDMTKCTSIHGYYQDGTIETKAEFTINPEDPHFNEMLEIIQSTSFQTKLTNLIPKRTKYHTYKEGDFRWEVIFSFDEILFPNGDVGIGDILQVYNFYGDLELYVDGKDVQCTVKDQEQWIKSVMDIIVQ